MKNIKNQNYFVKNFLAKLFGLIATREFPNCFELFIKIILDNLQNAYENEPEMIDTYLRIILNILEESDERLAIISGDVLPVILNIFKISNDNQKNREKCLKIISLLFNKLSFSDGSDQDIIAKILDNNDLIEECLGLFVTILTSNPKFLFDIKKFTIRNLDILIRDMPDYSSKFYSQLIEPSWRLIVLELPLYTENVIFNKKIHFTEDESNKIEDESHIYSRGYESEDEEEKYNLEGLILELIDFTIDLLKRKGVMDTLKSMLLTFLLCVKGYCMIPNNTILPWKNDPNLYITEEFEEENINSIRNKTLNLIKEITKELDDDSLLKFLKIIISEFTEGVNIDNYSEVIKLDDYNFSTPYFEKLNSNKNYILHRNEANLYILGTLAEDIFLLRDKGKIEKTEIEFIFDFIFKLILTENKRNSSFLVGRGIWCIGRLLSLVRHDTDILENTFNCMSKTLTNKNSDLSIRLVTSQCLSNIAQNLMYNKDKEYIFESENFTGNYQILIELLKETSEETLLIPIETIFDLTKLNREKSLYVPYNATKQFVDIYSRYYNHPQIGVKILELIKLWCEDKKSASLLLTLFVPFSFYVFDDFFKSLGKESKNFEEIKKTVITEHGNNDMEFKTNLEMLPVKIYFIYFLEFN